MLRHSSFDPTKGNVEKWLVLYCSYKQCQHQLFFIFSPPFLFRINPLAVVAQLPFNSNINHELTQVRKCSERNLRRCNHTVAFTGTRIRWLPANPQLKEKPGELLDEKDSSICTSFQIGDY